ncbi:unnamed protein product [Meganyctiphanes norvegica]|uniref:BRICHOS domain-containing protein n=1 Tax=Meganyctiphanes norvegica TaxID=48144 RepID=A0AAV2SFA4_MEGNR
MHIIQMLCAACLIALSLGCQEYELEFENFSGEVTPLQVNVCNQTISYHMPACETFEEVTTFEDYEIGFGATRVPSEEACYVRLLSKTLDEQVDYLQEHQHKPMTMEGEAQVDTIPVDDAYEELGDEIANFCDDFPAYKLVKKQDVDVSDERERQVNVTFRRCVIFFFKYICYTTTLTVPTGSTVTFVWFFFG